MQGKAPKKQASHGGPGRGQGRKPLQPDDPTVGVTIRMPAGLRDKLHRLGGSAWLRQQIERAEEKKP